MKKMNMNEIRKEFLDFFENKDHIILKSYPLIPSNDKSLLLTNAGMAPIKDYFTGKKKMAKDRAASSQKCIRTADIERVGKTHRHGTFFEMLGNFSFGDYFKRDAILWAWEFLTINLEVDPEVMWVSVYEEDDEAYGLWKDMIGVPEDKIIRMGREDNFWELEVGPCGPCTEIYVDRGLNYGCGSPDCKPGCECDRFIEVWNLVFTQFNKDEYGNYHPLPNKNVDTGMGLERITLVLENADTIFEIDILRDIIGAVEKLSKVTYNVSEQNDISMRVIADHIRAIVFLVYDGVVPSNEGRGYVLRRLIRRASRHGKLLGIQEKFLNKLAIEVMHAYRKAYPEVLESKARIFKIIEAEENKFQETIEQGMEILNHTIQIMEQEKRRIMSGEEAFKLYDTYGFPLDLSKEILAEMNFSVDEEAFQAMMEEQKNRSRDARSDSNLAWTGDSFSHLRDLEKTEFVGYEKNETVATVIGLFHGDDKTEILHKGEKGIIILDQTPFYGESGGQVGDTGFFMNDVNFAMVTDTKKNPNNAVIHFVQIEEGEFIIGDQVLASVNDGLRNDTKRNHSATHLLNKALMDVLGSHIHQAGSHVDAQRLRFDFTHFEAISKEDLDKIEFMVNDKISKGLPVHTQEMSLEESKDVGAVGLFEDKYKDVVRVVEMGNYSRELCGGTHVNNTAEIQMFKILSESSVSAGVRRIEAITGRGVYHYLKEIDYLLMEVAALLKSNKKDLLRKIINIQEEAKEKDRELQDLKNVMETSSIDDIIKSAKVMENITVIVKSFENKDMEALRNIGDKIRDKIENVVIVFAATDNGKLQFMTMVSKNLTKNMLHAGNIVKKVSQITGGNGGGRPDFASAGGKDLTKMEEALEAVPDIIKQEMGNQ